MSDGCERVREKSSERKEDMGFATKRERGSNMEGRYKGK